MTKKIPPTIDIADVPSASDIPSDTKPAKKLSIFGLPTTAAVKTGFGAGDRPEYKEKSSKKTGAKYRVRQ
jgi:hypothetical protein